MPATENACPKQRVFRGALQSKPIDVYTACFIFVTVTNRFMDQFLEFVINHWALFGLLVGLALTLLYTENQKRGAGISLHEATRVMNQEDGVVVDLRTEKEFKEGHITASINVPFSELSSRLKALEKHKQSPVILVCKVGQHSGAASKIFREAGFVNVTRMNGGIAEWENSNMPLVKGAKG